MCLQDLHPVFMIEATDLFKEAVTCILEVLSTIDLEVVNSNLTENFGYVTITYIM